MSIPSPSRGITTVQAKRSILSRHEILPAQAILHNDVVSGLTLLQWLLGGMILIATVACSPRIVAEGVHETLPTQGTLIGVWGTHPTLEHTVILWLGKRGLRVIDPTELRVHLSGASNATSLLEEESILEVAEKHDLREVVFVRLVGDQRAPAVLVRALTLPERQVAWVGSARYEEYLSKPTVNHLVVATCRAMAAAWGLEFRSDSARCVRDQDDLIQNN